MPPHIALRARSTGSDPRAFLDALPNPALLVHGGSVAEANEAAERFFLSTRSSLVGMRLGALLRRESGTWVARRPGELFLPVDVRSFRARTPAGRMRLLQVTAAKHDGLSSDPELLAIAATGTTEDLTRAIVSRIKGVAGGAAIFVFDGRAGRLRRIASVAYPEESLSRAEGADPTSPDAPTEAAAVERRRLVVGRHEGGLTTWALPVRKAGVVVGVVAALVDASRSRGDERQALESAVRFAGLAIERHLTEEARRRTDQQYRILSEMSSDFAYAFRLNDHGAPTVEWVTGAFTHITGYEVAEWERLGAWRGIVHPEDMLAFEQRHPRLLRGEVVSGEFRIVRSDGGVRWLSVQSRPVVDEAAGRVVGVVGVAHDFTRRKEAEDAKSMFLATASHELKTPLTVIRGFAKLVERADPGEGFGREAAETIERRSIQLSRIVDRIMLSSRIETGGVSLSLGDLDPAPVVFERSADFARATGRAIDTQFGPTAPVVADVEALITVLDHLLDNAAKYSPGGEPIVVRSRIDSEGYWVDVLDHGIGMTEGEVARCFDKFWQAESGDGRRFGGTGIGLFIVRSLVEAMGGEVLVRSAPGRGSAFSVRLRLAGRPEDPTKPPAGEPSLIREFMRQLGVPEHRGSA